MVKLLLPEFWTTVRVRRPSGTSPASTVGGGSCSGANDGETDDGGLADVPRRLRKARVDLHVGLVGLGRQARDEKQRYLNRSHLYQSFSTGSCWNCPRRCCSRRRWASRSRIAWRKTRRVGAHFTLLLLVLLALVLLLFLLLILLRLVVLLVGLRRLEQGQGFHQLGQSLVLVLSRLVDDRFLEGQIFLGRFHFPAAFGDQFCRHAELLLNLLQLGKLLGIHVLTRRRAGRLLLGLFGQGVGNLAGDCTQMLLPVWRAVPPC